MGKTVVLIHGTWHGGWAWQEVVRHLSAKGHRAYAPTLAGHGPGATWSGVTHDDCVSSVVSCIQENALEEVTLVGHSFGGTVVQKVAERIADRIQRTMFLDALILKHNESVFDILPTVFLDSLSLKESARQDVTNSGDPSQFPRPPWETWRDNFMQDATETHARTVWEQLTPEPSQVNLDKLNLRRFFSLAVPKIFIYCRQDKAMPSGYFHPGMSSRLGTYKLLEMDGSHEVMFSRPAEVAEKLIEAGSD